MKAFTIILFIAICQIGCLRGKDLPKPLPTPYKLEVFDLFTNQPIAGASVTSVERSDFKLSCLCFQTWVYNFLGYTDALGRKDSIPPNTCLEVLKDGYYNIRGCDAIAFGKYYSSEKIGNDERLGMIKRAIFEITSIQTQASYSSEPKLEIHAVLSNGTTRSIGIPRPAYSFSPFTIGGAGDITNRVIVTQKRLTGTVVDTLFKTDVFLPANTTKRITVTY
jgi:hypothetical protein